MNVDLVSTDWGSFIARRGNRGPVDAGGWSLFHTLWSGADVLNPALHPLIGPTVRPRGSAGPTTRRSRPCAATGIATSDEAQQKALAARIEESAPSRSCPTPRRASFSSRWPSARSSKAWSWRPCCSSGTSRRPADSVRRYAYRPYERSKAVQRRYAHGRLSAPWTGRKTERPVLRVLTVRRDVVWPEADWPLRGRLIGKADGLHPTQHDHSCAAARIPKADTCSLLQWRRCAFRHHLAGPDSIPKADVKGDTFATAWWPLCSSQGWHVLRLDELDLSVRERTPPSVWRVEGIVGQPQDGLWLPMRRVNPAALLVAGEEHFPGQVEHLPLDREAIPLNDLKLGLEHLRVRWVCRPSPH